VRCAARRIAAVASLAVRGAVEGILMARGTIAKLVRDRGFGFIRGNDGKDVFFHRSGLMNLNFDDLEQGATVDFEVENSPKGPRANRVRMANVTNAVD
jgi:CspA family cold shock protein